MKRVLCMILTLLLLFSLAGCKRRDEPLSRVGVALDVPYVISLYDNKEEAVADAAEALIGEYVTLWSSEAEGSDIRALNTANGAETAVNAATYALLETAQFYTITTDGAFDVTVGALTALWETADGREAKPTQEELTAACFATGAYRMLFGADTVTVEKGMTLDLGGIAAGAVADKLAEALKAGGCKSAKIEIGDNRVCIGTMPDGKPFEIEIADPYEPSKTVGTIAVSDRAVVTSSAYGQTYEIGGDRYPHVLDPKTGEPVENDLAAVTVLAPLATDADALATAFLVMGYEKANAMLTSYEDVDAVFVKTDGTVIATDGVERID